MKRLRNILRSNPNDSRLKKSLRPALVLVVLAVFITTLFISLYNPKVHAQTFLTTGTTWTVPSDWSNANNTIEVIGAGGGAGGGFADSSGSGGGGGGGGGGGAYAKVTNVTLTPGATVGIAIGAAGSGGASSTSGTSGGDTYLCSSVDGCGSITDSAVIVGAKGGAGGTSGASSTGGTGGTGGAAASGVGTIKVNGGSGGSPSAPASAAGSGGGGGGGTAGLATGANGSANTTTTGGAGGAGDGTNGGAGGTANGGTGGTGTEYDASHGSGGGGGGGNGVGNGTGLPGGTGGAYGAGGGGGGGNGSKRGSGGAGANGNQGLIRIIYNYTVQTDYRWRLDDGAETSGTSLAAQDTAATVNSNAAVRLRLGIKNQGDVTNYSYQLEYAPYSNGCGSWTAVPVTATTEDFSMAATSNYSDQAASSNVSSGPGVLTDPSGYSFAAGKLVQPPSNTASSVSLAGSTFTELEYAIQATSNAASPTYCFRVTNAGTPLENYANYPLLNVNYVPAAPTIYSVTDGSTHVSRLPTFQLKSTDKNSDYLQYVVEVCQANSWPCTTGARTYDQTSSQTCWSLQNAQSSTAFTSDSLLSSTATAYCQMPTADLLSVNTTYYMRAKAIDPGGSNTYSPYSTVVSFTTSSLDIQINGGTTIRGGTKIGN